MRQVNILIRLRECEADLNPCWAIMSDSTIADVVAQS